MLLFHDRTQTETLKNSCTSNIRTCPHDVQVGDFGQWSEYKIPEERARRLLIRFSVSLEGQMSGFVFVSALTGDLLLAMEGCRHDSHVFVVIAHGPLVKSDSIFQHLACVAT